MALFKKKQKEAKPEVAPGAPPMLPELPRLPEFPKIPVSRMVAPRKPTSKLPSYPSNTLGQKFSRDTIKEAVTGEKEDIGVFDEDDFAFEDETQMMQKPLRRPMRREFGAMPRHVSAEPVFIRIDRFEASLKTFENAKRQLVEIENMLKDIEMIREEEDTELEHWEKEIQTLKEQIEKVDKDVFSKVE